MRWRPVLPGNDGLVRALTSLSQRRARFLEVLELAPSLLRMVFRLPNLGRTVAGGPDRLFRILGRQSPRRLFAPPPARARVPPSRGQFPRKRCAFGAELKGDGHNDYRYFTQDVNMR